jgi:hypothetical protein
MFRAMTIRNILISIFVLVAVSCFFALELSNLFLAAYQRTQWESLYYVYATFKVISSLPYITHLIP